MFTDLERVQPDLTPFLVHHLEGGRKERERKREREREGEGEGERD